MASSFALHAAVLALVLSRPALAPTRTDRRTIEMEIVEATAPPAEPSAPPPSAASPAAARPTSRIGAGARKQSPKQEVAASVGTGASGDHGGSQVATGASGGSLEELASDRPVRALDEASSFGVTPSVARSYGVGSEKGPGGGRTLHPDDPRDLGRERAEEEALVESRIQDDFAHTQARARVADGRIDDYFVRMRKAMEKVAAEPPPFKEMTEPVGAAVRGWKQGAQAFGKSGNPYGKDERGFEDRLRGDAAMSRVAPFEVLNRYQDFIDGSFGSGIVALVEVRQASDGKLIGHRLVLSSGLKDFDEYVAASVPSAIASLAPAPNQGQGLHADGLRSLWAFVGKTVYAQPVQGAGDALSLIMGGSFDEVTGEVLVNRLDKPRFVCNVRLLEVY